MRNAQVISVSFKVALLTFTQTAGQIDALTLYVKHVLMMTHALVKTISVNPTNLVK
jgi:hypothetical protein